MNTEERVFQRQSDAGIMNSWWCEKWIMVKKSATQTHNWQFHLSWNILSFSVNYWRCPLNIWWLNILKLLDIILYFYSSLSISINGGKSFQKVTSHQVIHLLFPGVQSTSMQDFPHNLDTFSWYICSLVYQSIRNKLVVKICVFSCSLPSKSDPHKNWNFWLFCWQWERKKVLTGGWEPGNWFLLSKLLIPQKAIIHLD